MSHILTLPVLTNVSHIDSACTHKPTSHILDRSRTWTLSLNYARGMTYDPVSLCRPVLSCVGRALAMGLSPAQGVLPKCLKGFIVSEFDFDSEQVSECNL